MKIKHEKIDNNICFTTVTPSKKDLAYFNGKFWKYKGIKHSWLELSLYDIIQEYKNGSEDEPLDGDDVDNLTVILNSIINLQEGNITEQEYLES
jgi:hypothetical protein